MLDKSVQAAAVDEKIAAGQSAGPLAGVPVAVKDNLCTEGLQTCAASQLLRGYQPQFDATAVARLRAAGAVIVGKTNMDEFGMGSSTECSAIEAECGCTRNAWSSAHVPGLRRSLDKACCQSDTTFEICAAHLEAFRKA